MERIKLEKLRNTNSAFSTTIPWYIMGDLYSESSSEYEKGLGIFELERIIYSSLLYDKIVINTYAPHDDSFDLVDPISKILIEEGVIGTLDDEFIESSNFIEIAIKEGNYAGLNIDEISNIFSESCLKEVFISKIFEASIEFAGEQSCDLSNYFEPVDNHLKKIKFTNHLGADYNIPLIAGKIEDDLFKIDQDLGTLLLKEFIVKKQNNQEFTHLSNKIKNLKSIRLSNQEDINLPPLLTEIVKSSKGKIDNFPYELIKLRNKREFKTLGS